MCSESELLTPLALRASKLLLTPWGKFSYSLGKPLDTLEIIVDTLDIVLDTLEIIVDTFKIVLDTLAKKFGHIVIGENAI